MFPQFGLRIIPRQGQRVAAIGNTNIEGFFKIIDIRVMFPIEQGNKGEIVEFDCSYGKFLRLHPKYSIKIIKIVNGMFDPTGFVMFNSPMKANIRFLTGFLTSNEGAALVAALR